MIGPQLLLLSLSFYDADLCGETQNICWLSLGNAFTLSSLTYSQRAKEKKKTHFSGISPAASQYIPNFFSKENFKVKIKFKTQDVYTDFLFEP